MRRQDKYKNMEKANLVLEQSYLKSKGLINENIDIGDLIKAFGGKQYGDMNRETQAMFKGHEERPMLVTIEGDEIEILGFLTKEEEKEKKEVEAKGDIYWQRDRLEKINMRDFNHPQDLYYELEKYLSDN